MIEIPRHSGKRFFAEMQNPWLRYEELSKIKLTIWQRIKLLFVKRVYTGVDVTLHRSTTVKWKYLDGKIIILSIEKEEND